MVVAFTSTGSTILTGLIGVLFTTVTLAWVILLLGLRSNVDDPTTAVFTNVPVLTPWAKMVSFSTQLIARYQIVQIFDVGLYDPCIAVDGNMTVH